MQNNGVRVVARFIAKPESVEEVKRILSEMVEPTRSEDGCITYDLLHNVDDPTDFTFVEEWSSRADLDRHVLREELPDLAGELDLVLVESELHGRAAFRLVAESSTAGRGSRGSPSTRSPRVLRWIWLEPP